MFTYPWKLDDKSPSISHSAFQDSAPVPQMIVPVYPLAKSFPDSLLTVKFFALSLQGHLLEK